MHVYETTNPVGIDGSTIWIQTPDEFCPFCDVSILLDMAWDDTDPEPDEEFKARCWSCQKVFWALYELDRTYYVQIRPYSGKP